MTDLSTEQIEQIEARFPPRFNAGRSASRDVAPHEIFEEVYPLDQSHIQEAIAHEEAGLVMGVTNPSIKAIRASHHRIARMMAAGFKDIQIAAVCNYHYNRLSILRDDPAFRELIAFYSDKVDKEFSDFVGAAADLSMDLVQELSRRLEESPESFTVAMLNESIRTVADRSGNGPQSKQVNVNVNVGMGDRLRQAARRAEEARRIGGSSTLDD